MFHLLCMSVLAMCITVVWGFLKNASPGCEGFKELHHDSRQSYRMRISVVWACQSCSSRFYEGLKNVHQFCMRLSKICTTIYEGLNSFHLLWWAPQKCASQLYEGLQVLHLLSISISKICIAIYKGHQKMHRDLWRSQTFASPQKFASRFRIVHSCIPSDMNCSMVKLPTVSGSVHPHSRKLRDVSGGLRPPCWNRRQPQAVCIFLRSSPETCGTSQAVYTFLHPHGENCRPSQAACSPAPKKCGTSQAVCTPL